MNWAKQNCTYDALLLLTLLIVGAEKRTPQWGRRNDMTRPSSLQRQGQPWVLALRGWWHLPNVPAWEFGPTAGSAGAQSSPPILALTPPSALHSVVIAYHSFPNRKTQNRKTQNPVLRRNGLLSQRATSLQRGKVLESQL